MDKFREYHVERVTSGSSLEQTTSSQITIDFGEALYNCSTGSEYLCKLVFAWAN